MRSAGKQTQLAPSWSAVRGPVGPWCSGTSPAASGTVRPSPKAAWKRGEGGPLGWPGGPQGSLLWAHRPQGWQRRLGRGTELHCRAPCTCPTSTSVSNALFIQSCKVTTPQAS